MNTTQGTTEQYMYEQQTPFGPRYYPLPPEGQQMDRARDGVFAIVYGTFYIEAKTGLWRAAA